MGIQAWPFNQTATSGAPAVTARQWRQMMVAPFVAMGSAARPLGAKSGIRVGTPSSVVTITGTGPYGWSANGFAGVIDGEANAAAGPYAYSVDTAQTGSIVAAGAALRVDRLDMVISDSDEGDGSGTKGMAVVYTQGAATGGLPPNAPARSHKLALINVPTSGAPTITWAPDWSSDPGEWVFNTVAERDAYVTLITAANVPPQQSATVLTDTTAANNGTYTWSGSIWVPQSTAPWIAVPLASFWASYTTGTWGVFSYRRVGNRCWLRGIPQASAGAGTTMGTLPVGFRPPFSVELPTDRGGTYSGVTVNPDGTMVTNVAPGAGTTYAFGDQSFALD